MTAAIGDSATWETRWDLFHTDCKERRGTWRRGECTDTRGAFFSLSFFTGFVRWLIPERRQPARPPARPRRAAANSGAFDGSARSDF